MIIITRSFLLVSLEADSDKSDKSSKKIVLAVCSVYLTKMS